MRQLKATATKDLAISGPTVAAPFLAAGLVDELTVYVIPVLIGSGTPMFQALGRKLQLELLEERKFPNGVVFMRYRVGP